MSEAAENPYRTPHSTVLTAPAAPAPTPAPATRRDTLALSLSLVGLVLSILVVSTLTLMSVAQAGLSLRPGLAWTGGTVVWLNLLAAAPLALQQMIRGPRVIASVTLLLLMGQAAVWMYIFHSYDHWFLF